MNAQIKEITEQCWERTNFPCFGAESPEYEFNQEKFARMLISAVLEEVRDEIQYEYDWKLADAVTFRVLEHFGMKNE